MTGDRDKPAPSLEPPSLFGRKRKKAPPPPPDPPVEEVQPVEEPVSEPVAEPVEEPVTEPVEEPVAESVTEPVGEPVEEPLTVPVAVDDGPVTIFDEPVTEEPRDEPPAAASPVTPPPAPGEPREPREPWLTGRPAAALTGLLVGCLIVAATAGSLRLCTTIKGTSSCGGPGFFLLLAILVVAVLLGAAMLRAAGMPEPGSTSFLAVGLLSVVALLFLVGQLFAWWMIIVIPAISAATFVLSHWITATYIDPDNDGAAPAREREQHDVR